MAELKQDAAPASPREVVDGPGASVARVAQAPERMPRTPALRAIIAYKAIKGVLWLVLAAVLAALTASGLGTELLEAAAHLRRHTGAWSLRLAELLTTAAEGKRLWELVVALVADGTLTLVEGWALHTGRAWGAWLVVVSTGSLLPFEVASLVRHLHAERVVVLIVNLAIVVYLARGAWREHRHHREAARRAAPPR